MILPNNKHEPFEDLVAPPSALNVSKKPHGLKGTTRSPETCMKISLAHKGKTLSPETRMKISLAHAGKTKKKKNQPELFKENLVTPPSALNALKKPHGLKGTTCSPETRMKMSLAHTGKTVSQEVRTKMSLAHTGKTKKRKINMNVLNNLEVLKKPHGGKGKIVSEETRIKMSLAHTGKIKKKNQQDKQAGNLEAPKKPHPLTGRIISLETRMKMSLACKGKKKKRKSKYESLGYLGPDFSTYIKQTDKHKITSRYRPYADGLATAWRYGVLRVSSFKCFILGSTDRLECHHLMGWWSKSTRYDIANGVALSKPIHKQFHDLYGRGQNTTPQFEDFCQKYYGISVFPWRQAHYTPRFTIYQEREFRVLFSKKKHNEFEAIVESRQHKIVEGTYITNDSLLKLYCCKHNQTQEVEARRYKTCKLGLTCCSSKAMSVAVTKANKNRHKKNGFKE